MMKKIFLMSALALAAALPAAPRDEAKVREQALGDEPCSLDLFHLKPGQSYEYRWFDDQDLEGHVFLVLRHEPRRLLLELALAPKQAPQVVERRAWVRRNGQQRLLTESDGFASCETRLGVPLERLEAVMKAAEAPGKWSHGQWPKASKPKKKAAKKAAPKTEKHK
jgi:hypothetical protein